MDYVTRVKLMGYSSLAIIVAGLFILFLKPEVVINPSMVGILMSIVGAIFLSISLIEMKKISKGEVLWDERKEAIESKAGEKAFRVTFVVEGILTALLGMTKIKTNAYPVMGLLMATTAVTYFIFGRWYKSKM